MSVGGWVVGDDATSSAAISAIEEFATHAGARLLTADSVAAADRHLE